MDELSGAIEQARLRRRLPSPAARRALRENAGVSQDHIAKALGVTREAVSLWESGARTPGDRNLGRYLEVLNRLAREGTAEPAR